MIFLPTYGCATPEVINFMATHGRGLVCAPITADRCDELGLELMVGRNTALHATPFTVSVDLLTNGVTTGISASDRSKTILALIDPATKPEDLGKPEDVAATIAYLASDDAAFVQGAEVRVDGGRLDNL